MLTIPIISGLFSKIKHLSKNETMKNSHGSSYMSFLYSPSFIKVIWPNHLSYLIILECRVREAETLIYFNLQLGFEYLIRNNPSSYLFFELLLIQVSVPRTSLFDIVTVCCGHCSNLWSVNMAAAFRSALPGPDLRHQYHQVITLTPSDLDPPFWDLKAVH